jgi:GTP-binding protein EngB required for normal cell division
MNTPSHPECNQDYDDLVALLLPFFVLPLDDIPEAARQVLRPLLDGCDLLLRPTRQLTLLGTFKAGKSTLLNALLGAEVLPVRVLRATGVVTRIAAGAQPAAALVRRLPDSQQQREPVAFDERAHYILLDLHNDAAPDYDEVLLEMPDTLLPPDWTLVDTPGLMDDPALTGRSLRELAQSDLVLVVLSAYQLLSQDERDLLRNANRLLSGNVAVIINQIDLVAEDERAEVIERAQLLLQGVGNSRIGAPRIFVTAASSAGAGVQELRHWLTELMHSPEGEQVALLSRLGVLHSRLEQAGPPLQSLLTDATQLARQREQDAQATHRQRVVAAQDAALADQRRLGMLEDRLGRLGEDFVALCMREMAQRARTEQLALDNWTENWLTIWRACFATGLHWYGTWVYRGAAAALTSTAQDVPPFDAPQRLLPEAMQVASTQLSVPGFLEGLTAELTTPLSMLLGGLTGGLTGSLFDELAGQMRNEAQRQTILLVEQTARDLLPALYNAARHYLAQVHGSITAYTEAQHAFVPSAEMLQAQQAEHTYHRLVAWHAAFHDTVEQAQRRLPTS